MWFKDATSWTRANKMKRNGACEVWKVEEQKIMIKHNFSNSGAIMLEKLHNLNSTCKILTDLLPLQS
jgi:hypothetical protein